MMKVTYGAKLVMVFMLFIMAICTTTIAVASYIDFDIWFTHEIVDEETSSPKKSATMKVTETERITTSTSPTTTTTIGMIGDVLLHHPLYLYAEYQTAFAPVQQAMQSVDFLLANQESMPAGQRFALSGYPKCNSPSHIIRDLQISGVDFMTIANNHTLDYGPQQAITAIEHLQHYHMPYTGAFLSPEDKNTARIMQVNDISIAVLAYTYGTNQYKTAYPQGYEYIISYLDEEQVIRDIEKLRAQVDVIVLSLHWGTEYSTVANAQQKQLATRFTHAGADIIFGHHPHVLQSFEWVNGKPVYYSLGNFYSAQPWAGTNVGGIAKVEVSKTTRENKSTITFPQAYFYPTTVVQTTNKQFIVQPLAQVGDRQGWHTSMVEQHLGLPSW